MGIGDLVNGEHGRPADLVAALFVGAALAGLVLFRVDPIDWRAVLLALLAADIGAGLVSNATQATRDSWLAKASRRAYFGFLAVHLTLYPAAVLWLARGDWYIGTILIVILLAKVLLFWSGQRHR